MPPHLPARHPLFLLFYALCGSQAVAAVAPDATPPAERLPLLQITAGAGATGLADEGYRVSQRQLGGLGDIAAQELPFSVAALSADLIRNLQATNTTEAIKYLPNVYSNTGAGQITPYFTLRGFSASTWTHNMSVDGMRSFDIWQPLHDKERIEVFNGAGSFLYGVTSPAGTLNYVSKQPVSTPLAEFTLGSSDRQLYSQADLGGPLAGRSDLSYRLNLEYANAGETGVDDNTQQRYNLAAALAWQVNREHRLQLSASQGERDIDQPQALFVPNAATGIPKAPDSSRNWGPQEGDVLDVTRRITLASQSRLTEQLALRTQWRYSNDQRRYLMGRQIWQNPQLDYAWRLDSHRRHDRTVKQAQAFLDIDLATGLLQHRLTAGFSLDAFEQGWDGYRNVNTAPGTFPGNLYGDPAAPGVATIDRNANAQQTRYASWLLLDRISLGEHWQLLLGGTLASVDDTARVRDINTGVVTETRYDEGRLVPTAALSWQARPGLTGYLAYTEALQQGFVSSAPGNAGTVFEPFVSAQLETGIKTTLNNALDLNLAWFRIEQASQLVENDLASQDGRAVHQGWEFAITGRATDDLTLVGGFTLLDAEIRKASNAALQGRTPQGVPETQASLYAEYRLPSMAGLTLTGGLSQVGKVPVDAANTLYVKAVTLADLGLRYQTEVQGKATTWRAGISNLTGADYWATRAGMLYTGAPRTLSLSVTLAL